MEQIVADLRALMQSAGIELEDVARRVRRSVSYVSMQLSGKRPLTVEVGQAVISISREKRDRAGLLLKAYRLVLDAAEKAVASGDKEEGEELMRVTRLLDELIGSEAGPNKRLSADIPPEWEGVNPDSIICSLEGNPLIGMGEVFLAADEDEQQ